MVVGAMAGAGISEAAGTVSVVTVVTATGMVAMGTVVTGTAMDTVATATEPRTTESVWDTGLAIAVLATEGLATTATTQVRIPAITRRTQPTGRLTSPRVGFCIDERTRVADVRKVRDAGDHPTGSHGQWTLFGWAFVRAAVRRQSGEVC